MDLSSPNTRQKYLLKTKCLDFFSLQATAVDRCVLFCIVITRSLKSPSIEKLSMKIEHSGERSQVHLKNCFYFLHKYLVLHVYQILEKYLPTQLLVPIRLLISEKTSTYTIIRSYTIIWQVRVHT